MSHKSLMFVFTGLSRKSVLTVEMSYMFKRSEKIISVNQAEKVHLRRSAANDKIFKLFFLHPFLASTIYNNTIKNKFDIG